MNKIIYPDWVEKYRTKGRTIRKVRNGYGLYKCTSVYVPGNKYPKSVQTYLGMITEKDGFIPKKESSCPVFVEYGLSHFIMINFKRDLIRSSYDGNEDIIILGTILYMFGAYNPLLVQSTFLSLGHEKNLLDICNKNINVKRIRSIASKIQKLMAEEIPDENDRNTLKSLLLLSMLDKNLSPESWKPSPDITEIAERYGLRT